jgi:hypothetical protein
MTQPRKHTKQNTPRRDIEPVEPSNPPDSQVKNGLTEDEKPKHHATPTQTDEPIGVNILSYHKHKEWAPIVANIVSCIAVGVSLWLAIVTYRLYRIAATQSNSVIKAGDAAQSSAITAKKTLDSAIIFNGKSIGEQEKIFIATKKYNDSSLYVQQKAIDGNAKSSELTFQRESKSLDLQDSTLKETQKEFDIENKPFISIANIRIDTNMIGKKFTLTYVFINNGKQPCQIIDGGVSFKPLDDPDFRDIPKVPQNTSPVNVYLSYNQFLPMTQKVDSVTTKSMFDLINSDKIFFYVYGKIKYKSIASEKIYTFTFDFRVSTYKTLDVKTLISKTE